MIRLLSNFFFFFVEPLSNIKEKEREIREGKTIVKVTCGMGFASNMLLTCKAAFESNHAFIYYEVLCWLPVPTIL